MAEVAVSAAQHSAGPPRKGAHGAGEPRIGRRKPRERSGNGYIFSAEQDAQLLGVHGTDMRLFRALGALWGREPRSVADRWRYLHKRRAEPVDEESVARRCSACGGRFAAPSRFRFRCDHCLSLHAHLSSSLG